MNKFVKTIDKNHLYEEYLRALNGLLHLTEREIELMIELIKLDLIYDEEYLAGPKNITHTNNRKYLQRILNINKDNLSKMIIRLKEKGCLVSDGFEALEVNKALIPDIIKDKVQIVLIMRLEDEDKQWK